MQGYTKENETISVIHKVGECKIYSYHSRIKVVSNAAVEGLCDQQQLSVIAVLHWPCKVSGPWHAAPASALYSLSACHLSGEGKQQICYI